MRQLRSNHASPGLGPSARLSPGWYAPGSGCRSRTAPAKAGESRTSTRSRSRAPPTVQRAERYATPVGWSARRRRSPSFYVLSSRIALCLIARSARCDVRWVAAVFVGAGGRKSVVPPSPPAERRREHRRIRQRRRRLANEKRVRSLLLRPSARDFRRSEREGAHIKYWLKSRFRYWP